MPRMLKFRLERIFQSIKLASVAAAGAIVFRLERIFQSIKLAGASGADRM